MNTAVSNLVTELSRVTSDGRNNMIAAEWSRQQAVAAVSPLL